MCLLFSFNVQTKVIHEKLDKQIKVYCIMQSVPCFGRCTECLVEHLHICMYTYYYISGLEEISMARIVSDHQSMTEPVSLFAHFLIIYASDLFLFIYAV
jgi:hypothetical protein